MKRNYPDYDDYQGQGTWKMTDQEVAEACEAAASILEGHWTKGSWLTLGPVATRCIEGGLAAALGIPENQVQDSGLTREALQSCPVYTAVVDTLADTDADFCPDEGLVNWNDDAERTEAEVIGLLRATAKRVLGVPGDEFHG